MQDPETDTDPSGGQNERLDSVLDILLESYRQAILQTQVLTKTHDVESGERLVKSIQEETQSSSFHWQVIVGVLAVLLRFVLEHLPENVVTYAVNLLGSVIQWEQFTGIGPNDARYVEAVTNLVSLVIIVPLVTIVLGWASLVVKRNRKRRKLLAAMRREIREINDEYVTHSGLHERIQMARHERTANEAQLNRLTPPNWRENANSAQAARVAEIVAEIAKNDRNVMFWQEKYEGNGGDAWRRVLQAGLRGELFPFVPSFVRGIKAIEESRRNKPPERDRQPIARNGFRWACLCRLAFLRSYVPFRKRNLNFYEFQQLFQWGYKAKLVANALQKIDLLTSNGCKDVVSEIASISNMTMNDFDRLLTLCQEYANFQGLKGDFRQQLEEWLKPTKIEASKLPA